jgi:hypothetical protein
MALRASEPALTTTSTAPRRREIWASVHPPIGTSGKVQRASRVILPSMPTSPGPEFWQQAFHVDNLEDFTAAVGPYMPLVGWGPLHLSQATVAAIAWEEPSSVYGIAAAAALAGDGATNHDRLIVQPLINNLLPYCYMRQGQEMTTLVIPNVYRCSIQALSGGQQVDNVVGLRGTAAGQQVAAAAALKTAWEAATGPISQQMTAYVVQSYYVVDLSSLTGGITTLGSTKVGAIAGSLSTNAACALVKWNGGSRSRSTRGRMFFGPLGETNINADGRTLSPAYITALTTAFTNFMSSLSGAGFNLCVISPTLSSATNVTTFSVESVIGTQRRRIRS